MRNTMRMMALTLLCVFAFPLMVYGADKANVAGLTVLPYQNGTEGLIKYADGAEEQISGDFIGIFVNGSIIKDAGAFVENGRTLVPLRVIAESLGAEVDWAPENGRIILQIDDNTIVLYIGRADALVNGGGYFLDTPPRIIEDRTYVPLRFVAEAIKADALYSDGVELSKPYIIPGLRHVMISAYPKDWTPATAEQAVLKVKQPLIEEYEKIYGKFVPVDDDFEYTGSDVKEILRQRLSNLKVTSENDRFFVIPLKAYDLWADKYTDETYLFFNGTPMKITEFNPSEAGALAYIN